MKISYDGPPDFGDETITIKIELQPSEVADVIRKLIGPGAVELVRDQLPPTPDLPLYKRPADWGMPRGGTPGATQWNG